MPVTQIPTVAQPVVDDAGRATVPWFQFFMRLYKAVSGGAGIMAPADAGYVVDAPVAALPSARVLTDSATVDFDTTVANLVRAYVLVDAAGALDSEPTALRVRVDGVTVAINGSNQLQAIGGGGAVVVGPTGALDGDGTIGAPLAVRVDGVTVTVNASNQLIARSARTVGIVIFDGGAVLTPGVKGFIRVPFAGTISKWTVLSIDAAATAGDIVIDVWKDTLAAYPPTVADTITAAAKPTLSGANAAESSTLTGWTTAVNVGDVFGFNVISAATVTKVLLEIEVAV